MDHDLYIAGQWCSARSADRLTVINPATEQVVGTAPDCGVEDVSAAVEAAARAGRGDWPRASAAERAVVMRRFADAVEPLGRELAELITSENGSPIAETGGAAAGAAATLRWFAGLAGSVDAIDVRPTPNGLDHTLVRKEPVGVVGVITPWNFPVSLLMNKLAPALLSGCTVVLKPAPETPFDAGLIVAAAESAGVPAGVINLVPGGPATGAALVRHPLVDKIAFTGSTDAGRAIATACASLLRPVTLELGGKSAAIVLEDAAVEVYRASLIRVAARNTGQTCYAATRILAPASRYDEIVRATVDVFSSATLGDPLDPETVVGPLVSARQRDRVEGFIRRGRRDGATVAAGGGRPASHPRGFYLEPTVLTDVTASMEIARAEVFGPVVCVMPYADEDQAIQMANDSDYGLGGVVYGQDIDHATAVADRMATGSVGINHYTANLAAPFGGRKNSGLGSELGPEGLSAYLQPKSIYRQGPNPSASAPGPAPPARRGD